MFQAVFENSPVGLILVNRDTSIRDANAYMFSMFNLDRKALKGQRFGNMFNCSAVSGSGKTCGDCDACGKCELRGGMSSVLCGGISITDTIVDHKFIIDGQEQKKWFKVSASRIDSEGDFFAILSFADITIQKEYEELLNYRLSLDLATGTVNKYALMSTLKRLTDAGKEFTVALIDFDNFKSINDSHGHIAGDKVISHFCAAALANTRKQDVVGRFGGEEFMIVFQGAASGMLIKALERISKAFQESCARSMGIKPTFSAGLAEFSASSQDETDVDSLVGIADSNLYLSKSRGKNMITSRGLTMSFDK